MSAENTQKYPQMFLGTRRNAEYVTCLEEKNVRGWMVGRDVKVEKEKCWGIGKEKFLVDSLTGCCCRVDRV